MELFIILVILAHLAATWGVYRLMVYLFKKFHNNSSIPGYIHVITTVLVLFQFIVAIKTSLSRTFDNGPMYYTLLFLAIMALTARYYRYAILRRAQLKVLSAIYFIIAYLFFLVSTFAWLLHDVSLKPGG